MQLLAVFADTPEIRRLLKKFFYRRSCQNDVDDLVEEVILRLLKTPESTEDLIREPMAYFYGVAKHVLTDHRIQLEAEAKHVIVDSETVDEIGEQLIAEHGRIEERLNLLQQLNTALSRLPPTHALVLLLHKRDGLSYEEVAKQLDLSVHTVEKYVTQAKTRLREMLWDI